MKSASVLVVAATLVAGSAVCAQAKPMPGPMGAEGPAVLAPVKVGDPVGAAFTAALMVSVAAPAAKQ